jgi:hypothetical protein
VTTGRCRVARRATSSSGHPTLPSTGRSRPPARRSPSVRRISNRSSTGSSSSTGRSATTRAWRSSSAGSRPGTAPCSVATGPRCGLAELPSRRRPNTRRPKSWRCETPPNGTGDPLVAGCYAGGRFPV